MKCQLRGGRRVNQLEKAIYVALRVHEGQTDRYGRPYILHPLHVMTQMDTETEMAAAVLHDVVEDSDVTPDDLRAEGFTADVVEVVRLLTHDKEKLSYEAYVRRLKPHPIARKIKLADLAHNMDIRRMDKVQEKDRERLEKYRNAWEILTT
jgi:(p)ppGpp synthase/HD superfamily hydrolase